MNRTSRFYITLVVLTGGAVSSFFTAVTNFIVHSAKDEKGIRSALYFVRVDTLLEEKHHELPCRRALLEY